MTRTKKHSIGARNGGYSATAARRGARRAFTITELLIVIFIIGLLTSLLVVGANKAISVHKGNATRSTMRTITGAIELFAAENPLRANFDTPRIAYDPRTGRRIVEPSFGKYPPYSLAGDARDRNPKRIRNVVEPDLGRSSTFLPPPNTFAERIATTLGWTGNQADLPKYVTARTGYADRINDDNRALYTYLKLYAPSALAQVPGNAIRPLSNSPEFVFPNHDGNTYTSGQAPPKSAVDVLGFYDAWGVPLDYFLYVKAEFVAGEDGIPNWRITDRRPALRSRGMSKEDYLAGRYDESLSIYSEPLPAPTADIKFDTGALPSPTSETAAAQASGWLRLRHGSGTGNGGDRDLVENYWYR